MKRAPFLTRTLLAALALAASTTAQAQPIVDAARRFSERFFPYAPGSVVEMRIDRNTATPFGTYLALTAVRTTDKNTDGDQMGLLVDQEMRTVAAGILIPFPPATPPVTPENLARFVDEALPAALGEMFATRVRVRWPAVPARRGGVVPLVAEISTGYGWPRLPVSLAADGLYLAIGGVWPLDRDPREVRRELLEGPEIQWDPGHENALVKVVEFSDYQCPACKRAWSEVKPALVTFGDKARHGMVNFPLVRNHPWAFRAAVAGACFGKLWPDKLLAFKEELYRLQDTLTVSSVDDAALGFVAQHALAEPTFRACYLKDPAVDAVLRQMDLGQRLGVIGTPSYFANGEALPANNKEVFTRRLQAIIAAGGKPEAAAEIAGELQPAPTAKPSR
ncbi:MAG: DsbA family protein [Acidobacteriota bacterium]